ncbi:hypothetical protein BHE74_00042843 [Ensete ventricosum]|nr:hypothetical protein GW17_00033953 [Ensete ventricosum]RWW50859.1 hypothetical protein BHE74_00042843 [Ensete ventricosum]
MIGQSQVQASGQSEDDAVGNSLGERRELAEGIESLPGWHKGVHRKKTETHQKIIGGSRKACRELESQIVELKARVAPEAVVAIEQRATELEAEVVQKKSKLEESKRHLEESQQLLKESRYKFRSMEDQLLKLSWDVAEAWSKAGKVKEALAEETRATPETTEGHRGVQGVARVSDRNLEVGAGDV